VWLVGCWLGQLIAWFDCGKCTAFALKRSAHFSRALMPDTRTIILEPGTWYAGYHDIPFIIPESLIANQIAKWGFTDFTWTDREDGRPPLDPRADPRYTDTWDGWVSAKYAGPERTVKVPYYDHVDWLLVVSSKKKVPYPAPEPKRNEYLEAVLVVCGLAYVSKRWRRGRR